MVERVQFSLVLHRCANTLTLMQKLPDALLYLLKIIRFEAKIVSERFRGSQQSCSSLRLRFDELARLKFVNVPVRLISTNFSNLRLRDRLMERYDRKRAQHWRFEIALRNWPHRVSVLTLYLHNHVFIGLNYLKSTPLPVFFDE